LLNPRAYNWLTFTLADFEVEWDRSLGDLSMRVALLGFQLRVSWNYEPETDLRTRLAEMMAEFEENTHVTMTHAQYKALKEGCNPPDDTPEYLRSFGANNVPVEDLGAEPMGWEKAP
jgi:hypothetical protein